MFLSFSRRLVWCIRWSLLLASVSMVVPQAPAFSAGPLLLEEPFATWNRTAERVQSVLERDQASTAILERLRDRLASERSAALEVGQATNVRVRTLQAQLDALGPPPAEGATESNELAARRGQLVREIAEVNAPLIAANGAFQRADVLIKELDRRIRERRTADLLTRYPSAIFVQQWPEIISEITQWAGSLSQHTTNALLDPIRRDDLGDDWPIAVALMLAGLLLLFYGHPATVRKLEAFRQSESQRSRQIWLSFGFAVVRVVLPGLAATCLILAWRIVAPVSEALRFLDGAGVEIAIDLILAYWLAHMIFSPTFAPHRVLSLDDKTARRAAQITIGIGVLSAFEILLDRLDTYGQVSPEALALVTTPFMVAGGVVTWALAAVLMGAAKGPTDTAADPTDPEGATADISIGAQFLSYVGIALKAASVAIPLSALLGYTRLSRDAFDATVQTIALLTIALVLFHAILSGISLLLGRREADQADGKTLLPIVVATLLAMALLPLLALVWGARATDIAEIWRLMSEGVRLGDARISVDGFLTLILVFSVGLIATRWLQAALRTTVLPRTRLDIGARNALSTGVGYVGITLAGVMAISSAGVDLSNLALVAGALSLGIGFGMQTIVSNFVSGIILLIERPIKHGDWIEVSGFSGYVRKISVRSTRIETFDRHDVIIPNADLISSAVKNMTLTSASGRIIVPVSIAYGSDVKKAKEILLAAAQAHVQVLRYPAPYVLFMEMGDSGLALELRGFLRDVNNVLAVRSDLMTEIYTNLRDAGIEIPFPQRDVHLRTTVPQPADSQSSQGAAASVPAPDTAA